MLQQWNAFAVYQVGGLVRRQDPCDARWNPTYQILMVSKERTSSTNCSVSTMAKQNISETAVKGNGIQSPGYRMLAGLSSARSTPAVSSG